MVICFANQVAAKLQAVLRANPKKARPSCRKERKEAAAKATKNEIQIKTEQMPTSAALRLAPDREVWEVSDDSDVEVLVVERLRPMASSELAEPEDVFSYVDKISQDFDMFKKYVEGIEQQNAAAAGLVDRMKQHELFPRFCEEVGAEAGLWGQDQEQAATELSLFEESLAEKEQSIVNAALVNGASAENQVAKALDEAANAETQLEYDVAASQLAVRLDFIMCLVFLDVAVFICCKPHAVSYQDEALNEDVPRPDFICCKPHAVSYQDEALNEDVPRPDDLDGESLGEEEPPEAPVSRVLDEELKRVATPAESSVLPAARSAGMDAILQEQRRRNDERVRLVAESAAVRDFRAGKVAGESYKYPMKVISEGMLAEVDAMNNEAEPPRYGDQQCIRRGRKKAAEDDEDDDDKPLNVMNADEVMLQMEEHCRRESVEAKLTTTRSKKKKEEVEKEASDEENYEDYEAEEEDDEEEVTKDEEDKPKVVTGRSKAKKAPEEEEEEDVPKRGRGTGKAKKAKDDEEDVPKRAKAKKKDDEEEEVPRWGKGKKAKDEDDVPKRGKGKKEEDEVDVPKRGKNKKQEDEVDVPKRGKNKKQEDEEDVPKRGKAKKVEDEEEDVPKRGKGKKKEDEEEEDVPKRGKGKKKEDEEEEDVPKWGKGKKVKDDKEEVPKRGKAKRGTEDEEEVPKEGKGRGKAKRAKQDEEDVPKVSKGRGKAEKGAEEDEEDVPKVSKGRGKAKKGAEEDEEDGSKVSKSRGKAKKREEDEEPKGRVSWEEGAMLIEDEEDEPEEGSEMMWDWDEEDKADDEDDVGGKGKKEEDEEEEDVPKRGKGKKVKDDKEEVPKRGKAKKAEDEEDVPKRGKAKKVEDEEEDVPKRGKGKKKEDEVDVPKRGKNKKQEDEEEMPKSGKAKRGTEDEEEVTKECKGRGKARKTKQDEEDVPKGSKGRGKAKKGAEEDEEDVSKASNGKRKPMKAVKGIEEERPGKKAKNKDDDEKCVKEIGLIVPPDHVQSNHIYSNAYRYSLALGHDLEEARNRARTAADEFRRSGRVPVDYVNGFRGAFIIESDSETIEEDVDVDMAAISPLTKQFAAVDMFCGEAAIGKSFRRAGLPTLALDVARDVRDVRKKFMLHGLVCPNRRGLIDFGQDRWEDAKQPADTMSIASEDMSTPGQLSEELRVPLKQKVDKFFNTWPGATVKPEGLHVDVLVLGNICSFGIDHGHAKEFLARRTKAKTNGVPVVHGQGADRGWLLPAVPKGPENPSKPASRAVCLSIPVNQAVNPSSPVNHGAVNPSVPVNQAVNPSVPVNQAVNPSVPVNQAVNRSVPNNCTVNSAVKEALTPPKAAAAPVMMIVNPSVPVKHETLALVRSPPPRAAVSAVAEPKSVPLVKTCAVPPPVACTAAVATLQAPVAVKMPALPPAASAAKSTAEPPKALNDPCKKAKMAPPPCNPPKKAAAPSNPPGKAAALSDGNVTALVYDEQSVMKSVGKLHVLDTEMAIFPETYEERQSLYACFKRKLKKGDEVPDEFANLWVQACSSNSRSAKTALFHKWLTAGKDFGRLTIQLDRSRTDAARGSQRMGWRTRAQLMHLHQNEVLVDMSYVNEHETRAATRLVGGASFQNLGTNTMYGACTAPAIAGTGDVGCLGMPGGSSSDVATKGGAKGKGKGKGKAVLALHANGQPKFGKKPKKLEDVMPETAVDAAEWCTTKLIKAMGEAKTLSVRLACVKHQEQLCTLIQTHSSELETSYAQLQGLKAAQVPDSQLYAASELCRQRLALFWEDKASGNRVCPKPKKAKKDDDDEDAPVSEVQELAAGAMSWCASAGGKAKKGDLVIFPDVLARAVWDSGKDVFEHIYFGKLGRTGAAEYWENVRARCAWYPPNIPESCHSGLIPVSLYGDEVHAYRNTDPGAVSVVGWCSDLSFGVDAMLQYGLICVYSEYCECETTYGEIMEAVLPRLNYLCDPNALHPWKDEFRFVLCGVRGDLKWINDKYKIHNYRLNDFCSRCSCVKTADNVYETITAFGDKAQHVPVNNSAFCDAACIEDWPWPMRFGVHLERFCHDTCHSQLLGSGKCLNGSALTYLCEQGFFTGGQFGAGVYDVALQAALRIAYSDFQSWCKAAGLRVSQPSLASKAVAGKTVTFWLAYRCVEYAERDHSTPLDRLVAVCVWSYADLLRQFDECPLILSEVQARNMRNTGQRHLESWANLRSLSGLLRAGKVPNRNLWMILPKMHHLKHALDDNPPHIGQQTDIAAVSLQTPVSTERSCQAVAG
ncbi:unnamed protein product [Symbiodinium sp. CCMP2456]|nr:unnamed protein product [Symbiodinium sp. CCMP2456]